MVKLRGEFKRAVMDKGFGFVEGSKWSSWISEEKFVQEDEYKTESQVLSAECGSAASTAAKIAWAKSLGEGEPPPGDCNCFYRDPTRGGEYVYLYMDNLKHRHTESKQDGRQTKIAATAKLSMV